MLRTTDRYILGEIAVPFGLGLALTFCVLAFAQVLRISDAVTGLGIGVRQLAWAVAYSVPPLLGLVIPVSCLFASLWGFGRLGADGELTGLHAIGISPYRLLRMPLALGTGMALFCIVATVWGEPWGIRGLRQLMGRSAQAALRAGVLAGTFYEWIPGITLFAGGRDGHDLREVILADRTHAGRLILAVAQRGELVAGARPEDLYVDLTGGSVWVADAGATGHTVVRFVRGRYRLHVGHLVGQKARRLSPVQEMGVGELYTQARGEHGDAGRRALLQVTLHRKFCVPAAAVIYALLAACWGARGGRGVRARGMVLSCLVVAAHYYVSRVLELSARAGRMPAGISAWCPDAVGVLALAVALYRLGRRPPP